MSKVISQLSTYDETTKSWKEPIDIGAKAENVEYEDTTVAAVLSCLEWQTAANGT